MAAPDWPRAQARSCEVSVSCCGVFTCLEQSPRPGRIKQNLADPIARRHELMGMSGLRQRQHLVEQRVEPPLCRERKPELEVVRSVERVANDRNPVQVEILYVKRHNAAGMPAGRHQTSAARERNECLGE